MNNNPTRNQYCLNNTDGIDFTNLKIKKISAELGSSSFNNIIYSFDSHFNVTSSASEYNYYKFYNESGDPINIAIDKSMSDALKTASNYLSESSSENIDGTKNKYIEIFATDSEQRLAPKLENKNCYYALSYFNKQNKIEHLKNKNIKRNNNILNVMNKGQWQVAKLTTEGNNQSISFASYDEPSVNLFSIVLKEKDYKNSLVKDSLYMIIRGIPISMDKIQLINSEEYNIYSSQYEHIESSKELINNIISVKQNLEDLQNPKGTPILVGSLNDKIVDNDPITNGFHIFHYEDLV